MNDEIKMRPIGYVSTIDPQPTKFDYEIVKKLKSKIVISNEFEGGLTGLGPGDFIDVIYYMHEQKEKKVLFTPRYNNPENKEVGIFARRSIYSPSAIGITTVKLLEVSGNEIIVLGLDANDKSPVLDIKRYAPEYHPEK